MAEHEIKLPKAEVRAANPSLFRTQISGFIAGGLVFCVILMAYFSALFAKRAFLGLGEGRLFRTFVVGNSNVYGTKSAMENICSLYKGRGSSHWAGYEYTGQMMLTDARGGVGIIFLAHHRQGKDCFYRLKRCGEGSTFAVGGYPSVIKGKEETDTEVSPEAGVWHRFRIEVQDSGGRTEIRAKVWEDSSPEPAKWQIDCFDAGSSRVTKGSVGVWACSEGEKYFDDLIVKPIYVRTNRAQPENSIGGETIAEDSPPAKVKDDSESKGQSGGYLFHENFDRLGIGVHPEDWSDRLAPLDFSEAADGVSRFFRMNLLDFGGPWDEIADWMAITSTFCLAGLFAGIAFRLRARIRQGKAFTPWKWRIPFEFLPFVALFIYDGARKGVVVVLYAVAGLGAGFIWALLNRLVLKLLVSVNEGGSAPDV
jgi:hypothetical protein